MVPLLLQLTSSIPTEFRLPEEIRVHFKDGTEPFVQFFFSRLIAFSVGTSAKGTYVDTSKIKPPRLKYGTLHSVIIDAQV